MIPRRITRDHVLAAMARIDIDGIPADRRSRSFDVLHEGRVYPPKFLLSIAHEIATGQPLPSGVFTGGSETNGYLRRLGFTVVRRDGQVLPPISQGDSRRGQTTATTTQIPQARVENLIHDLVYSGRLHTCPELNKSDSIPPQAAGVYAWFFASVPANVPTEGCIQREGKTLLYVGISPGSPMSEETLSSRIRFHYLGHAEGSTLRLTLGCLLEGELGTVLRRVGTGKRMTFGPAEARLSTWMSENAAVTWVEVETPWLIEKHLIQNLCLPLNIEGNSNHAFYAGLRAIRSRGRKRARQLPILG